MEAIELLSEKTGKNPQDPTLLIKRAEIMEQTGNLQGAFKEYESYLTTWPVNYTALEKEAAYFGGSGKLQAAIDVYTTILTNIDWHTWQIRQGCV